MAPNLLLISSANSLRRSPMYACEIVVRILFDWVWWSWNWSVPLQGFCFLGRYTFSLMAFIVLRLPSSCHFWLRSFLSVILIMLLACSFEIESCSSLTKLCSLIVAEGQTVQFHMIEIAIYDDTELPCALHVNLMFEDLPFLYDRLRQLCSPSAAICWHVFVGKVLLVIRSSSEMKGRYLNHRSSISLNSVHAAFGMWS